MKDLVRIYAARPALNLGILMIGLVMLLSSTTTLANDLENELVLESWMAAPFENEIQESEMSLESWMALPFGIENEEEEIITETWMSDPWI